MEPHTGSGEHTITAILLGLQQNTGCTFANLARIVRPNHPRQSPGSITRINHPNQSPGSITRLYPE